VRAFNEMGYLDSEYSTIVLGDVPNQPSTAPTKILSLSSSTVLTISYPALATGDMNGLPVISYSLEIDDG
jgi:hypothetical protein